MTFHAWIHDFFRGMSTFPPTHAVWAYQSAYAAGYAAKVSEDIVATLQSMTDREIRSALEDAGVNTDALIEAGTKRIAELDDTK